MTNIYLNRKKLRGGTALHALALMGASIGGAAMFAAPAAAQDYTSGAISGTVTDGTGSPVAAATVTAANTQTGVTRTATTGSNGSYRFTSLLPGTYDLTVQAAGLSPYTATGVRLLASQTANIPVTLVAGGEDIVVTGEAAVQAFTGTTTGLNVDVESFIKDKPLGRTLQSIIQLAPGTVSGNSTNSTFNGLSSLGGASVAENAYYVNGLNITNFDNYLGSAKVPFYFYKSVDVKLGGYQAEFGRATGGIVNAVTKSGSNDFSAALHVDWAPNFLQSRAKDIYTRDRDGNYFARTNRKYDESSSLLTAIEASGPIIKDRLFVYGLLQLQNTKSIVNYPVSEISRRTENSDPFWGVKVDAYPIDSQHLEFTIFDNRNTDTVYDRAYSVVDGSPNIGAAKTVIDEPHGGVSYVGKYTGNFTDWFTVSAAFGRVRDRFDQISIAGAGSLPYVQNSSGGTIAGVPNGGLFTDQTNDTIDSPYNTERKFIRADADIYFSAFGDHHIRFGYDQEKNTLNKVSVRTGADQLLADGYLSQEAFNAQLGNAGYNLFYRAPLNGRNVVELNYFNTGGSFESKNQAYYLEDEWQLTDRLTLNLGVRRDDFRVNKPGGNPLVDLKKNYAPRLGFTYDVPGTTGKLFGSYGWYYLPVASNTAFRQGAPSYYFSQRYYSDSINPQTGLPSLDELVQTDSEYQTACPFALVPNGATTNCAVTGNGADIDTTQAIDSGLKATRESEVIVGYEHRIDMWSFRLTFTHRNLDRTAEDSAIDAAVIDYCNANGIVATDNATGDPVACGDIWTGFNQYVINNPGKDITVGLLAPGTDLDGREVTLTADQLGYGPAKRTYDALQLKFDRAWNGSFSVGGSYTWSKSRGNIEGYVQSDFGQTDAGITQDFDQPGFVDYSYGYLPSDRRHILKLYGAVALNDDFTIGVNSQFASPNHLSCYGYHPTDRFARAYRAASHYCGGQPSPRGEGEKTDWLTQFDVQLGYNLHFGDREVRLRADVFNLFNSRAVMNRNQLGDLGRTVSADGTVTFVPDPTYGLPNRYQSPRYVRLGLDIAL